MKKRIYFENLDGLRFLCFLSIFLYHSFYTDSEALKGDSLYRFVDRELFANASLGVNFFFVLSGFLITYLLIEEKRLNGRIHVRNFWIRRMLRTWPLYFACVFFGFFIFPLLKAALGQVPRETAHLPAYLAFLSNFDLIRNGLPDASVLGVLWSVAIEEQFYFIWPLILFMVPEKKLWAVFAVIISGSLIYRAAYDSEVLHELSTFSAVGDLTTGALGAWLMHRFPNVKERIANLKRSTLVLLYLAFFTIYFFRYPLLMHYYETRIFERFFCALVMLMIILEQCFCRSSLFKLSGFKTITRLGVVTYGLYCLHFIGILVTLTITRKLGWNTQLWQVFFLDTGLSLAISIVMAKLCYRFFEIPFLRLKERFAFITK